VNGYITMIRAPEMGRNWRASIASSTFAIAPINQARSDSRCYTSPLTSLLAGPAQVLRSIGDLTTGNIAGTSTRTPDHRGQYRAGLQTEQTDGFTHGKLEEIAQCEKSCHQRLRLFGVGMPLSMIAGCAVLSIQPGGVGVALWLQEEPRVLGS